jgi:hypothetical protein
MKGKVDGLRNTYQYGFLNFDNYGTDMPVHLILIGWKNLESINCWLFLVNRIGKQTPSNLCRLNILSCPVWANLIRVIGNVNGDAHFTIVYVAMYAAYSLHTTTYLNLYVFLRFLQYVWVLWHDPIVSQSFLNSLYEEKMYGWPITNTLIHWVL